ncbi:MAG TPA: hypothetical protein VF243_03680, partial [Nitrosospira sp.]
MRDNLIGRWNHFSGFDRVLMTVAATFLTFAATAAHAQTEPANNPAQQAIDSGVPMPEPANVPPPTAADFKPDTATAPAATSVAPPVTASPAITNPAPATAEAAKPAAPVVALDPAAE